MVSRTVAQRATILLRQEGDKLFSPEIYGTDFVRGDIKRVSYGINQDLKDIASAYSEHISSRVRAYLIDELDEKLEDVREADPDVYEEMQPRIISLKNDLKEINQEDYVLKI